MGLYNYENVKEQALIIEEKRLIIKELKKRVSKIRNLIDNIGDIYEYLAIPLCAISITLVALFKGVIVYILPLITAIIAINVIAYKFVLNTKLERLNNQINKIKEERKSAYETRENIVENIFDDLHVKDLDTKDYYHQLVEINKKSNLLSSYMIPYKQKRKTIIKYKRITTYFFDYLLAPLTAIVLPLSCSFMDLSVVLQVVLMSISSFLLLSCALLNERLGNKIEELSDEIDDIKSDRTVNYVKRDIMLTEALEYLISIESSMKI